jgi:hypothetical protein
MFVNLNFSTWSILLLSLLASVRFDQLHFGIQVQRAFFRNPFATTVINQNRPSIKDTWPVPYNVKVKLSLYLIKQAPSHEDVWRSGDKAPCIINLGTR